MKKDAWINIGLLTATLVIFFGATELALRVSGIQRVGIQPIPLYQRSSHEDISYELKPNVSMNLFRSKVTTNSLGFRSPEINPNKPTIVILGDSIAFGYGVNDNETIAANVQEKLPDYNVLNTAAPGYFLSQESAVLREKVLPILTPDVLIVVFHFNDLDPVENIGWLDADGIMRARSWNPNSENNCDPIRTGIMGLIPGKCWLDRNSALYGFMKKIVNARTAQQQLATVREEEKEQPKEEPYTQEDINRYLDELALMTTMLPANTPKVFALWPEDKLHEELRPKLLQGVRFMGFETVDFYDVFQNNVPILGWDTVHPNAEGTKKGAEVLSEIVRPLIENGQ